MWRTITRFITFFQLSAGRTTSRRDRSRRRLVSTSRAKCLQLPRWNPREVVNQSEEQSESVFSVKYRVIDVGPELFQRVEHAVQTDLRSPALVRFHPRVGLCRVIRIADARGRSGPH